VSLALDQHNGVSWKSKQSTEGAAVVHDKHVFKSAGIPY